MTIFDKKRLANAPYAFDVEGIRSGTYSDKYFRNVQHVLTNLAIAGVPYAGSNPRGLPVTNSNYLAGDVIVEVQIFNRRRPRSLVAGIDAALHILKHGTGVVENGGFTPTWQYLDVTAVHDGVFTAYGGDPMNVNTVLEIRGRYRDFVLLETALLGVLSRASRIATNVYSLMEVINGKSLLFFPARFDLPSTQAIDGYAYWLAVQRYNNDFQHDLSPLVSTDAQGAWWGGEGGGTVPHALIACFLADTSAAMEAFAEQMPPDANSVALVDFNNDVVGETLRTLKLYWDRFLPAYTGGDRVTQNRWTLYGVRLDTSANLVDASLQPEGKPGVNEDLVRLVRDKIDSAWRQWGLSHEHISLAQDYCKSVGIIVSGGFNRDKIERFESAHAPVSAYGVGSSLFSNESSLGTNTDYTMDVVRVQIDGEWHDIAKVGRQPCDNVDLLSVNLSEF